MTLHTLHNMALGKAEFIGRFLGADNSAAAAEPERIAYDPAIMQLIAGAMD